MGKPTTEAELMDRIAALGDLDEDQRNQIVCALIGHSRIVSMCFGYVSCARCATQIGDTLGGCFDLTESVIVGHKCSVCTANFEKLDWADKVFAPDPFPADDEEVGSAA